MVHNYIVERRQKHPLHFTLLDPGKMGSDDLVALAIQTAEAGTDGFMIGGSTDLSLEKVDAAVDAIKEITNLPVILFPTHASSVSGRADAIFFMSLLNSESRQFLIGEQIASARWVKKTGLEPLSMAYLVVAPGMAAGRVGQAQPLPRDDPNLIVSHALAGQYLGMKYIYLEAGSGAEAPVPAEIVSSVRNEINSFLIVGGGIRSPEDALEAVKAGADIIVTGTLVETSNKLKEEMSSLIKIIHSG
ncbi:MAG TPA: geranylgeranylglyceryl/heptaprenylglyceryl phosphate synthase [Candidatus Poseidoniia archaeon]|nr:geranylgeranylglyceryl/heptaprenylglyceryl phosphate synthase [Candidatus Poseidoniia archaeon]